MAAGDGLISMKPTSITHAGTSASINADGGVDFTAVTSLSLNGVFTSDYDNYLVVIRGQNDGVTDASTSIRLRAAGSDASGANYVRQFLNVDSTTVSGRRDTGQTNWNQPVVFYSDTADQGGVAMHIYGPYLAQPTAARTVNANAYLGAYLLDHAYTHSLSTSYDGFTMAVTGSTATGTVHVFGYEE